jgi:hypothetical protein
MKGIVEFDAFVKCGRCVSKIRGSAHVDVPHFTVSAGLEYTSNLMCMNVSGKPTVASESVPDVTTS